MSMYKLKNYVLRLPNVRISLRNKHFPNAERGPLKYVGPGPSAPHFENVHFEKGIGEGFPLIGVNMSRGLLVYIDPVKVLT